MKQIKLFGDEAKQIKDAMNGADKTALVFIVEVGNVEGRDVITLTPDPDYWARQDNPEAYEESGYIGHENTFEEQERNEEIDETIFQDTDFEEAHNDLFEREQEQERLQEDAIQEQEILDRQEEIFDSEEAPEL